MSFLGGVFDDIGNAVSDIFGGSGKTSEYGGGSGVSSFLNPIGNALSSALDSQQPQQPSAPGMGQFGPHQNSTDNPTGAGRDRALQSEDPRVLEAQWLERMRRFRTLGLITTPPKYSYGEQ